MGIEANRRQRTLLHAALPSLIILSSAALSMPQAAAQIRSDAKSTDDLKKLSVEELLGVEVTSVSRRPEKLFETAAAVHVIGSDEIRRSGATRIPEILRLAPNLHVAQMDATNWAISSRGFNNGLANKLLVLVDGRAVYTPMFAGVFWDVQDTLVDDIDRVEVVSGPGGTVWGANAVNGVISVNTKSAADTQGLLLQAGGGNELRQYGGARFGGELGSDAHYRVYGKYSKRDSTELPNGLPFTDDGHVGRGGFRLDWNASSRDRFTIQGDLYDGENGEANTANQVEMRGGNILGRWERVFSEGSNLKLQFYYDNGSRSLGGQFTDDVDTYDVDLQHRFAWGQRHDVVWGLGFRQIENKFEGTPIIAFLPVHWTHQLFSGFVQDEIALADDRLRLTVGSKIEHNDYTGFEVQPSIRLAAKVSDRQTLWSAVSRAVRAPARIDHDLFVPNTPPFLVAGGPDFRSEVLLAYEVGYRAQPTDRVGIDLATFYNDYDRLRSVESVNPLSIFPFQVRNGLEGRTYGAELTTTYRVADAWRLSAGYRYLDLKLSVKPGSNDTTGVDGESHDPDQQLLLRSSLDLPGQWQVDATFRYVAGIVNYDIPSYEELDLRLAWRPAERLQVSVVGQNLLHDRQPEFNPIASRREIERSVYGMIAWGF